MTRAEIPIMCDACPARRSTLPFDQADMVAMRLRPAQFARIVGVSKQSVSKWIAAGKVTLGPDGRLDPQAAIEDVLRNTAPAKLRSRIFRQAMQGADALRKRIRELECAAASQRTATLALQDAHAAELAAVRQAVRAAEAAGRRIQSDADAATRKRLGALRLDLLFRFEDLRAARDGPYDGLQARLRDLQDKHFPDLV